MGGKRNKMERIKLSEIKIRDNSCMRNDPVKLFGIKKSLQQYGQLKPIIVDESYNIIEGHLIFQSMKDLNFEECWIKSVPGVNKDQLYVELNLLQGEPQPVEFFKKFKNTNLDDNCIPFQKQDLVKFVEYLQFDNTKYKESKKDKNSYLF